jgi:hypothetical protein
MGGDLKWKTTFNGRRPQNIKSGISQINLRFPKHILQILKRKMDPMGDNLKCKMTSKHAECELLGD